MRTFDELLDDLAYRARWERDEVESAKQALRSMRDADVAAERERCGRLADSHKYDPCGGVSKIRYAVAGEIAAAIRGA